MEREITIKEEKVKKVAETKMKKGDKILKGKSERKRRIADEENKSNNT